MKDRIKSLFQMDEKYYYLIPVIIVLTVLLFVPLLHAFFGISMFEADAFVGFDNYRAMVNRGRFIDALGTSLYFTALSVGASFGLGLGISLLLKKKVKGKSVFQSIYIIPMAMAPAIVAYGFRYMLNPSIGVVNQAIRSLGFESVAFFGTGFAALHTLILIDIWQWTPFVILVLTASLESLPDEPFEAAKMAGASKWRTFKDITLPMIKPAILIVLVIRIMDALKLIDEIVILTRGGPGRATETLSVLAWRDSFSYGNLGSGTAVGLTLLFIIIVLCWIFVKLMTREGKIQAVGEV